MDVNKTVVINYLGKRGGGPAYTLEMARGLTKNGCRVIAFISERTENIDSWKKENIELEIIDTFDGIMDLPWKTLKFLLKDMPALKKKYKDFPADAVYIPMDHPWTRYIDNIFKGKKLIYTIHDPERHSTNLGFLQKAKDVFYGINPGEMDEIVILSQKFVSIMNEKSGVPLEKIHVIPHGILNLYEEVDDGSIYQYDKNKTNFLFFGRIDRYKGINVLEEAYELVYRENDQVTLTIVGSGTFDQYRGKFSELKNATLINQWIPDEKVASYFKDNGRLILVIPYVDATQSGVIPIAMKYGVTVIASDAGGLSEQVQDGVTGYLCKSNDAKSLAEKMLMVAAIDNEDVRNRAREYISNLDWMSLSRKLIDII